MVPASLFRVKLGSGLRTLETMFIYFKQTTTTELFRLIPFVYSFISSQCSSGCVTVWLWLRHSLALVASQSGFGCVTVWLWLCHSLVLVVSPFGFGCVTVWLWLFLFCFCCCCFLRHSLALNASVWFWLRVCLFVCLFLLLFFFVCLLVFFRFCFCCCCCFRCVTDRLWPRHSVALVASV